MSADQSAPHVCDSDEHNQDAEWDWLDGAGILAAVIIVVFVTAINDYRKEKQFRKLQVLV